MTKRYRPTNNVAPIFYRCFPGLQGTDWRIRSPYDDDYQCIAWAAMHIDRHMWPHADYAWFPGAPIYPGDALEVTSDLFVEGFSRIGYKPIGKHRHRWVPGFQKLAIYATEVGVTHMARQRILGRGWLSKAGDFEDIIHRRLEDIEGDVSAIAASAGSYGKVVEILRRGWWSAFKYGCVARAYRITREMRDYRRTHKWDAP